MFRGLAILIGLAPFLLAELVCVVCGWGLPDPAHDPFVGFTSVEPLFVLNPQGTHYETAPQRLEFFARDTFPVRKVSQTKRFFCLGGSTVQGNPYSIETSFTTWLRLSLEQADPRTRWEVINCGGVSYASYRLVPILQEVLQYEPDGILICCGHNEFLEDRTYQHVKVLSQWNPGILHWLLQRRLVVLGGQFGGLRQDTSQLRLTTEVDALLDYHNGLAAYHRDYQWQADVTRHYAANLRRMVTLCQKAGVPVLLMRPCSNLSGQPPFKSEHSPNLTPQDLESWNEVRNRGLALSTTDLPGSVALLQQAIQVNPESSQSHYELGRTQELQGDLGQARKSYLAARDLDICPLRMITPLEQALDQVAGEFELQVLDLHRFLEDRSPKRILGDEWLVDHVHPSIIGHQEIGLELVRTLIALGWTNIRHSDWEQRSRARFAEHIATLQPEYFYRGNRHLELLRGWTRGESAGPPIETRVPHRVWPTTGPSHSTTPSLQDRLP